MFTKYLTSTLGVPPTQIKNLRDKAATKVAIEKAIKELGDDPSVPEDAALLLFFAGHGAEVDAPTNRPSGHVKGKIQMLLPHDFNPQVKADEATHGQGLLDVEFARLLEELATKKSDNITVIVDSCHSGSCTRSYLLDDSKLAIRGVELPDNFVIAVQQLLNDFMADDETRAYVPSAGYETIGHGSHMLLAGCMQGEEAKENKGHGAFTTALLNLFRDHGVDKLTYRDVIDKLPDLPSQHPQCEGANMTRFLFNGQIHSTQVLHNLSSDPNSKELILEGGDAHGITTGAEFAVYEDDKMEKQLGTVTVTSSTAFSSVCISTDLDPSSLSPRAFAKMTRVGDGFDVRLLVPMHNDFLRPIRRVALEMESTEETKRRFFMVDRMDENPDLILTLENQQVHFEIGDRVCREHGMERMSTSVPVKGIDDISRVLLSSADFYWHLRRSKRENKLSGSGKVTINCVRLVKESDGTYLPDSQRTDFNVNGVVAVNVDDGFQYGFKINNQSKVPLYAALFFFDVGDLSITKVYVPGRARYNIADASIPAGGTLTIGYGSSGTVPRIFCLKEHQKVAIGYLKLFLSNKYVDFSNIEQNSPFDSSRGTNRPSTRTKDLYEAICITVVQKNVPVIGTISETRPPQAEVVPLKVISSDSSPQTNPAPSTSSEQAVIPHRSKSLTELREEDEVSESAAVGSQAEQWDVGSSSDYTPGLPYQAKDFINKFYSGLEPWVDVDTDNTHIIVKTVHGLVESLMASRFSFPQQMLFRFLQGIDASSNPQYVSNLQKYYSSLSMPGGPPLESELTTSPRFSSSWRT
ncbi:hypothetical protein BDP27DRAFT_834484 [Rhodocollybia butyracea]|uniref:Peptidase C14 caspase domain-containing protein n=1 Tax=Rhodocollybia butyracea TaxID=206335 RepID=A0A9P5U6R0_9AGAR|nr:hypothetical protein BDP27DRAFT_834484 [Rhodocollybia butyracea]